MEPLPTKFAKKMMRKIGYEALSVIAAFSITYLVLLQVDWMTLLNVEKVSESTEKKLGELYWEIFKQTEAEICDDEVVMPIDSLLSRICTSNNIDKNKIKLHILNVSDINAFALPDNHLILFSGLIEACEKESELAAVLAHEIAHMELRHIMKKLIAEVGLSVLLSSSNDHVAGSELSKEVAKMLSTSAYSRNMEKEADLKGIDYMISANINPEGMAEFFFMLSSFEPEATKQLAWVSSHSESGERAKYILDYIKNKEIFTRLVLTMQSWENLKSAIKN